MNSYYHWYRVHNSHTQKTMHVSEDFIEACDWMISRAKSFIMLERNVYERDSYAVEEMNSDSEVVGFWTLDDLLDENPNGLALGNGNIKIKWKDENKNDVVAMYREDD